MPAKPALEQRHQASAVHEAQRFVARKADAEFRLERSHCRFQSQDLDQPGPIAAGVMATAITRLPSRVRKSRPKGAEQLIAHARAVLPVQLHLGDLAQMAEAGQRGRPKAGCGMSRPCPVAWRARSAATRQNAP